MKKAESRWVAETGFVGSDDQFYESGGVYGRKPRHPMGRGYYRRLAPVEATVACRCGQLFVATEEGSAEENRDMHFYGDKDCPSICREAQPGLANPRTQAYDVTGLDSSFSVPIQFFQQWLDSSPEYEIVRCRGKVKSKAAL